MGGGAGSIWKTLMGVVIMGVLTNALNVVGVTAYPQKIVRGAIILAAVLMDLRSPNLVPVFDDPVATIVYNANRHDVDTVWVAGKMLVENKKLLPVEESWVLAEGQRAASSIYEDYKAGKSGKCWEDEK